MLLLFLRAVLGAVLYGPYLALLSVPITIIASVVGAVFGLMISFVMLLGVPGLVIAIPLAIALTIGMTAAINVQVGRYACSVSGLRLLTQQRDFNGAFWDCFLLVLIVNVAIGLILAVAITLGVGWERLAGLEDQELFSSAEELQGSAEAWLLGIATFVPIGIYGFFVIPHACLTERAPPVYGMGWILARFLIVLPLFSIMTVLAGVLAIFGVMAIPGLSDDLKIWVLVPLLLVVFLMLNGFLMGFEARFLALVTNRYPTQPVYRTEYEADAPEVDYRALREEWSRR